MPVSSFSNRSFAYRRGDKQGRIVSRVGPYPVNKPSTTTSNGVEYTRNISGMYAFGHTPGPPNYGNLNGGANGNYNHGWWNGTSSEQNVAHFAQIFTEATSHTEPQIDGQYGFKTVSFHGPNNKLYGWIEHNSRWSNDPNDAQTNVGSGNLGGGNIVFQVNGPGTGVTYTYYFDPNTIDNSNTDSPAMDDITDLRFWSGSYPADDTSALGKSKGVSYDFGGGNLLTWTKAPANITQAERTITNATLAASAQPGDIVVVENSEIQKYTNSGGWYSHTTGNCIFAIKAVNGNVLTIMFADMMYYPANGSASIMNQSLSDYFTANPPVGDVPSNAKAGYMPESNQSGNAGSQRWRGGVATLYSYFKSNIQSGLDTSGGANDPPAWGINISGSLDPAVTPETNNFQEGVNGLLSVKYIQRSPGFSSIQTWRDKDTYDAPNLNIGAQIYFSNTTDAGIFRNLLSGVVQLPTTIGGYSQYNGHKPIRFHFKDGTTQDFGPDDGSTTQRVWSTGGSSTQVTVYTTPADNSSRTMSLSGGSMTTVTGGSYNFASTASRLSGSDSSLAMGTSNFTIDFWLKINTHTNARQYLFDLGNNEIWASVEPNGSGLYYWFDGYAVVWTSALQLDRWYHIRFTRYGSQHFMFVDGINRGNSLTINRSIGGNNTITLNSNGSGHSVGMTDGNISDFRIIRGTALQENANSFIPPGAPSTAVAGTNILTAQNSSGGFVDNGPNNITFSSTGTVTPQGGAIAPVDFTAKEIIGISYATITGHGGHDDPYLIGQNVASHLFHNNQNGQTQIFGQYTDP